MPGPYGRDGGFITAETAAVVPVLVLFTTMQLWGLMAAAAQIQCVDAARAGARAAARSETREQALASARESAPRGARVRTYREGPLIRVDVTARAPGPGRLGGLLSVDVRGSAVALDENAVGDAGEVAP